LKPWPDDLDARVVGVAVDDEMAVRRHRVEAGGGKGRLWQDRLKPTLNMSIEHPTRV